MDPSTSNSASSHIDFLKRTPLSSVLAAKAVAHRTLVTLVPHSTVSDALHLFSTHRIKAAPIIDPTREGRRRYLGVLSLFDLLIPITSDSTLRTLNLLPPSQHSAYLSTHPPAVFDLPVLPLLGMTSESAYPYHSTSSSPLSDIIETLSHSAHRLLIFHPDDTSDHRTSILTQMDVVRFLTLHLPSLGPITHRTLVELGLASQEATFEHFHRGGAERNIDNAYTTIPSSSSTATSAPAPTPPPPAPPMQRRPSVTEQLRYLLPSSTALSGFSAMHPPTPSSLSSPASPTPPTDVTALPIVDPHNFALQSTLSASDLRAISADKAALLGLPVLDYLRELWLMGATGGSGAGKGQSGKGREEAQRVPYIFQVTAKGEWELGRVMKEMVEDEVHRSWVVDDLGRVVGVVTLTDVLRKMSPFDEGAQRSRAEEEKMSERKGE